MLAANILGPRPQVMPQPRRHQPEELPAAQAGRPGPDVRRAGRPRGPVPVQPRGRLAGSRSGAQRLGRADQSGALFGIGRSLYFCIPQNQNLLAYWDTVADRLFKIRNSENIQGVVQQLPLFDPPLDPGMLVQAAAAGIDIGSIVSGLNQPPGPVRSLLLIQKALEIAAEVRSLGGGLLAALEKGDAEQLALLRQDHEVQLQQMIQNVRYLQWQHAQETTNGLLKTRAVTLERYTYYLRLLNLTPDHVDRAADSSPWTGASSPRPTSTTSTARWSASTTWPSPLSPTTRCSWRRARSPSTQSGATGQGQLYLNKNEDAELNTHLPTARDTAARGERLQRRGRALLTRFRAPKLHLAFWGMGVHSKLFEAKAWPASRKLAADVLQVMAGYETGTRRASPPGPRDTSDAPTTGRSRPTWPRASWRQIGRQIIASLIAEQVAYHDYQTVKTQVQQAQDVQAFLQNKFTNAAFYTWMQSDLSGLYYQYYRFACDTARQAEQTMKQELMRPELDETQFIQFNYWDTGHQGLLSGEALHLDIKRMEMAYHDNNKRELELTRHVSLRQLDPLALLSLRITGSCTVTVPEWLYDRDCPGHYMRRIKSVSVSVPSVVGPYTSLNCTVTLQSSTRPHLAPAGQRRLRPRHHPGRRPLHRLLRVHRRHRDQQRHQRQRHVRDQPAGRAVPAVRGRRRDQHLEPVAARASFRQFDYTTISDVILHIRYTARQAGDPLGAQATKELVAMLDTPGAERPGAAVLPALRLPDRVGGLRERHRRLHRHAGQAVVPVRRPGRRESDASTHSPFTQAATAP